MWCWVDNTTFFVCVRTRLLSLVVQPLLVADNSPFSPTRLQPFSTLFIRPFQELSMLFTSSGEDGMAFHVFLFLLVVFLLLCLVLLWRLCWLSL